MPKMKFIDWAPYRKSEEPLIEVCKVLRRYQKDGFVMTIRQLYYQLVAANIISNNLKSYTSLSNLVSNGRMGGLIDWDMIVDLTRQSQSNTHFENIADALNGVANQYAVDTRVTQPTHIEVWVEKDALTGVIEPVCSELDVSFLSCRGFVSLSEIYRAVSERLQPAIERQQNVVILHLADHDPSGMSMTQSIRDQLHTFLPSKSVKVKRIGLNMKQVQKYQLPPNFAKPTDTRYKKYKAKYGAKCWELDALKPNVLQRLIRWNIDKLTDQDKRDKLIQKQRTGKSRLTSISRQYGETIQEKRERKRKH